MVFSMVLFIFALGCDPDIKGSLSNDTGQTIEDSGVDTGTDSGVESAQLPLLVVEAASGAISASLSLHSLEDWSAMNMVDAVSPDSRLVHSGGYVWLLERGSQERISKYDPSDIFQTPLRYDLTPGEAGFPSDVSFCGDRVFVTLYDGTELLVLDPEDLTEETRLDISQYADGDGLPEASSMVCKEGTLIVSLHRENRNEVEGASTPQQIGSLWLFYDSATLELEKLKEDIGYRGQIYDIAGTDYLGVSIHSHIDVSGTTGFWTYGIQEDAFHSQIYSAFNDMAINSTAFDTVNAVHIAKSWYDDSSMAFCHPLTPGASLPNNMLPVSAPVDSHYHHVFMDDQGRAWIAFERHLNEGLELEYGIFPVDPIRCELHSDEIITEKRVVSAVYLWD